MQKNLNPVPSKSVSSDYAQNQGTGYANTSYIDFSKPFEGNADLADNVVDLLNNAIGIEIGKNNEGSSQLELATKVLDVFKTEGLWVTSSDKDGNITIQRQKIGNDQYKTAKNNLNKLDQNGMSQQDSQSLDEDKKKKK